MALVLPGKRISQNIIIVMLVAIACIASMASAVVAHAATRAISPTDHNIHYVGRWDTSSSATYTSYWPGAYFKTRFTGTSVKLRLAHSVSVYVLLDNRKDTFYHNVSGTVNLTSTLLAPGTHSLRVAAFTEQDSIAFQGLLLDAGATTVATPVPSQLIEFVGDSITAGATDSKRALSDYAWLIGERLAVQHTQIAYGGICLVDHVKCYSPNGQGNGIGMSRAFFKLQTVTSPNSPDWDFTRYQANEVVINLGTNDAGYRAGASAFQSTYITFLQNIRSKYPNARIFVMRPFNGNYASNTRAAVQAVNGAGDRNVQYVDTTGWLVRSDFASDDLHPTDAGQVKAANKLGPILAPVLGLTWKNL